LEAASFPVGNIAPDSGIPDEKWEKFTTSPEVTHFGNFPGVHRKLADMEFYRRHLLPLRGKADLASVSFRTGYFFHLITDNPWSARIGEPTAQRYSAEFEVNKNFIWEVKKDWYGLDYIYVRGHPESLFWKIFLTAQPSNGDLDFLPLEAVRQRVETIQQDYQRTDQKVQKAYNRPYITLSGIEMDQFIDESTRHIARIYQQPWIKGINRNGFISTLDLTI
jgi:hypothetical protein